MWRLAGAEPDIFIWGGHWRGQFCNKGNCQCSVYDCQKETYSSGMMSRGKFWGGQAKFWGSSGHPSSDPGAWAVPVWRTVFKVALLLAKLLLATLMIRGLRTCFHCSKYGALYKLVSNEPKFLRFCYTWWWSRLQLAESKRPTKPKKPANPSAFNLEWICLKLGYVLINFVNK